MQVATEVEAHDRKEFSATQRLPTLLVLHGESEIRDSGLGIREWFGAEETQDQSAPLGQPHKLPFGFNTSWSLRGDQPRVNCA